ncbi:Zf-C2HC5-domain-containing protein [Coniochaeta hoffmannii]|uniref:Zf-C2HC5-domain-containing protein n=1 Tax=Coniochaeta hoffmannii TaxID=91930 RepID=A0AA38R9I0_9PEZI|nr:Zf-C2HC5-domain-containing protein [Coniochaeta hoffmannii]
MSISQLSRLLPLPDSELQQVLEYGSTLSKDEAAEHFTNLLGDSPQVIEFISSFNSRRADPKAKASSATPGTASGSASASRTPQGSDIEGVPRPQRGQNKKKKAPLHTPAPRQVAPLGPTPGMAYSKKSQEDDYMPARSGTSTPSHPSSDGPTRAPPPKPATPPPSRAPPSAAGSLVSDLLAPKSKSRPSSRPNSTPASRSSTPGPGPKPPPTKISITGGTPMHGASTAVTDLDEAIRSLELTTNPKHPSNSPEGIAARRCNCVATRHPLQSAAPNCLSCGKVICVKEGLGPCTFCGTPLLSSSEVQSMIKELKAERGREKMAADREAHRRPEVAAAPRPFTAPRTGLEGLSEAEARAREHRDRLLAFQAQNAQRTTVRDEAADFDVVSGASMWASPEERARELKRQQKLLREMEWNARPEYEKRRQVVSIDLVGRKVVKKMAAVDRPPSPSWDEPGAGEEPEEVGELADIGSERVAGAGGAFSRNPLLGGVIKPVYEVKGNGLELEGRKDRKTRWRRVQDDLDDNEAVILDGGVYGPVSDLQEAGGRDEPA